MPARVHICASSRSEGISFVLLCIIKIGSFHQDEESKGFYLIAVFFQEQLQTHAL
jgi:hypothetical protein